ncbi:hypothetical protein BTE28158_02686 [Burkholderia territorii]|nr:hypothetical protein BTE28158_02686 [Burkholderia territorii]
MLAGGFRYARTQRDGACRFQAPALPCLQPLEFRQWARRIIAAPSGDAQRLDR